MKLNLIFLKTHKLVMELSHEIEHTSMFFIKKMYTFLLSLSRSLFFKENLKLFV